MAIIITQKPINPWPVIQEYQDEKLTDQAKFGATSIFIGTMRDFNEGNTVQSMYLDYYPGMTEKLLTNIVHESANQWRILDSLIVHRVGGIKPDEIIVALAVWASHRGDAFDACRFIIESLKSSAPFWKKEMLTSGETRWVEKNTDGYAP